ncbi:MAG TPA: hypothetical protein VEY09_04100 [Pyrinomonadaceae bacterium]|nr:hypothetical protein [Pyrinomonadaceae bacterium]
MRLLALCGAGGTYHDFNVLHLSEVIARGRGLSLPRSTPRRFLQAKTSAQRPLLG